MKTGKTAGVPRDLEGGRRRFERWRQRRKPHSPIPASLWAAAVKLAGRYGVSRTAKTLGVGYYALKERVERETAATGSSRGVRSAGLARTPEPASLARTQAMAGEPALLELAVGSLPDTGECRECLLEWEDARGATMRVQLKGVACPDLVALSRSFWEDRP
jgi:hypothetical protein